MAFNSDYQSHFVVVFANAINWVNQHNKGYIAPPRDAGAAIQSLPRDYVEIQVDTTSARTITTRITDSELIDDLVDESQLP